MGSFSRWASFLLRPMNGLLFGWDSFLFKAHEWAPFRDRLLLF